MVRGPGETPAWYVVYAVTGSSQFWFVEKPQNSYRFPEPLGKVTAYLSTAVIPGAAATLTVLPTEITWPSTAISEYDLNLIAKPTT